MYVLLPAGHPLAERRRMRLEDLRDDPWIVGSSSSTCPDAQILMRACQSAGFEPRINFNSDDYLAIQGFVAAGMGVSLIPDLALLALRDDVVVRSLRTRPPVRHILAGTLAGGFCSPAKQAMLEILCEVGREFEAKRETLALAVSRSPRGGRPACRDHPADLRPLLPPRHPGAARALRPGRRVPAGDGDGGIRRPALSRP